MVIPLLRSDLAACSGRLSSAVEEMLRLVDGNRIVRVTASSYFSGGIETEEQWDLVGELGADSAQGFLLGRPGPLP